MNKTALISVSDKNGLLEFAKGLKSLGFTLLTTSGSGKFLKSEGLETLSIEDYTQQKEILDGRVKTLHPKIHAGLLAKADNADHLKQLAENDILAIDVAVINLYPFIEGLNSDKAKEPAQMIELIDIGGPTMIRAAAKNFKSVLPLIDPTDYNQALEYLKAGDVPMEFRRQMASKVFTQITNYDLEIAKYISCVSYVDGKAKVDQESLKMPAVNGIVLEKQQDLRYGENPHQKAVFYKKYSSKFKNMQQLGGKELSYNNLLDFNAALDIISSFKTYPTCCIVKHLNPCGVASASNLLGALIAAKKCDPRSHFGGVIAFNQEVDERVSLELTDGFVEIVIAPAYSKIALDNLQKRKNLRILKVDLANLTQTHEIREIEGGVLWQEKDLFLSPVSQAKVASQRKPSAEELHNLQFAWEICRNVKSNAVILAKDNMLIAVGAGQMSRIDSTEVAIMKAKTHNHILLGAVCASDAFFPFPDSVEKLVAEGVTAFVAPAGAKRDEEVVDAVNKAGAALLFVEDRHFKH